MTRPDLDAIKTKLESPTDSVWNMGLHLDIPVLLEYIVFIEQDWDSIRRQRDALETELSIKVTLREGFRDALERADAESKNLRGGAAGSTQIFMAYSEVLTAYRAARDGGAT